jgi:hypothetical protein
MISLLIFGEGGFLPPRLRGGSGWGPRAQRARKKEPHPALPEDGEGFLHSPHLDPRGAAVGAGIVGAFESAVGVEDHRAGMTHGVGIARIEHLDIVPRR